MITQRGIWALRRRLITNQGRGVRRERLPWTGITRRSEMTGRYRVLLILLSQGDNSIDDLHLVIMAMRQKRQRGEHESLFFGSMCLISIRPCGVPVPSRLKVRYAHGRTTQVPCPPNQWDQHNLNPSDSFATPSATPYELLRRHALPENVI